MRQLEGMVLGFAVLSTASCNGTNTEETSTRRACVVHVFALS
jgi:hypothetical protein